MTLATLAFACSCPVCCFALPSASPLPPLPPLQAVPASNESAPPALLPQGGIPLEKAVNSCVQRDLEPANHLCSCASLDRGLHEPTGMLALSSSVSSNLHVSAHQPHSPPPPSSQPAVETSTARSSIALRISVMARRYDTSSANCTAPVHRGPFPSGLTVIGGNSRSWVTNQRVGPPKYKVLPTDIFLELADPISPVQGVGLNRVFWIGHHT